MNYQTTTEVTLLANNPAKILIVDDVPENIRLLSSLLENHGYQTRKAVNGKMALTATKTTLPDLILLDIRMPEMSGYEVCKHLKSSPETANIPVIFLSAADEVNDKIQGFQVGGADYITKPFYIEEVLARVKYQLTIIENQKTICDLNTKLEEKVEKRTKQLEIANAKLSKMAFEDPLTKLPNRALFMKAVWDCIKSQATNPNYQFAVLYLDCDRFKFVNDTLGHLAGDELLIALAQRLQSVLREDDLVARIGGDEFVILINQLSVNKTVKAILQGIYQSFAEPFYIRKRELFLSFSIGIVNNCANYNNPDAILRDADIAMYTAKSLGKNQHQIFMPSMQEATYRKLQIETELRKATQTKEFTLYYQPILKLTTNQFIGVEALIRWHNSNLGWVSPTEFIPIAEETGLIFQLGEWTLQQACYQLYLWQKKKMVSPSFYVSVNVSACQFSHNQLIKQIDKILAETQLPPQCLKLEITETAIMDNVSSAAQVIEDIRQRNIQLSIDDFGTGYSSLSYLHSFPVDSLKIDSCFIQRLEENPSSFSMVKAIIQIANNMGMNIIAEGIETQEQFKQLQLLDCHFGQGFLFSQPVAAEKIPEIAKVINSQL